jgi:hypothetical protein
MRLAACLALLAMAAGASAAPPGGGRQHDGRHDARHRRGYADPSAVIAAEIAFKQLAERKGQWTAWLDTAAPEARVFAPQLASAHDWLKSQPNPATAEQWDTHDAWMSCDGSIGVTRGAWHGADRAGQFVTIWQRQPKGGYKWLLRQETVLPQAPAAPEMLSAHVADCDSTPPAPVEGLSKSEDGTVRWMASADAAGTSRLVVRYWKDGAMRDPLSALP